MRWETVMERRYDFRKMGLAYVKIARSVYFTSVLRHGHTSVHIPGPAFSYCGFYKEEMASLVGYVC